MFGEAWKEINHASLKAYFGLLLLAGVYRSCGEAMECLWDDVKGRPIFKATMSLRRFQNISRVLRFDDKSDRADRRARDKLAPIRVLWDKWANNLKILYNPNECVTVDEQLVAYRGECPFRQYIHRSQRNTGLKFGHCATLIPTMPGLCKFIQDEIVIAFLKRIKGCGWYSNLLKDSKAET